MSLRGGALVPFDLEVERVSFTVKPLKIFSLAQKATRNTFGQYGLSWMVSAKCARNARAGGKHLSLLTGCATLTDGSFS